LTTFVKDPPDEPIPPCLPNFRQVSSPHRFGFLIIQDFPLLPLAAATETLRIANWLTETDLYEWSLLTDDSGSVRSSSGLSISPRRPFAEAPPLDSVIVFAGGRSPPNIRNKRMLHWLQRLARNGCRIGAAGLGSFILARAGLLDGYRCTVHWKLLPNFRSEFPKLDVTGELYEIDRTRCTSSGGTGTLDMVLALIGAQHGATLASHVAEELIHRIRPSHEEQRMALRYRLDVPHTKVLQAVKIMENAIEEPTECRKIAAEVGISTRQLEKLFQVYLAATPNDFYRRLRLDQARRLLMQTTMSVLEVGAATGFSSPSHFSKAYRAMFGVQPRRDRARYPKLASAETGTPA
jgi:transcriptional regulator GlxA family with amidase domain